MTGNEFLELYSAIQDFEKRMVTKLDNILERMSHIEKKVLDLETNQAVHDHQVNSIKDVVVSQQLQIERYEVERLSQNLIISGLTEDSLCIKRIDGEEDYCILDDMEKVETLCGSINDKIDPEAIESVQRIGSEKSKYPWKVKVCFSRRDYRNSVLYGQKVLKKDPTLKDACKFVFFNKDRSYFMQKEEKRLRDRMKSCLLYTSPSPRDLSTSRMPSSA